MRKEQREELARRILQFSGADQTEVLVVSENSELTRFTQNAIHQNVAHADVSLSVRAISGKRTGVARTNDVTNEEALREVVRSAIAMAELAPEDPLQPALPSGGIAEAPAEAYVPATAGATPTLRARRAEEIFAVAEDAGQWAAGFVTTSATGVTIANSNGALASFDGTDSGLNVKMNADDSTGFAERYSHDVADIDATAAARIAAEKARASARPRAVDPGDWTVILEPAAFGELFMYLTHHFSAQSFDEGSSFLTGALGTPVLGENVTIRDDYAHPLAPGMPFDYEGQPKMRLPLVENGIARSVVTDSYYANKLRRENTGHALPAPNAHGPQATSLVVEAGSKPLERLIEETGRGLLISRFWYIRTVDQKKAVVTGMTRDGTFLIENGKISGGVRNMRFNHSVIEALKNCELSNELRRTGGYAYSCVVPSAKIDGFTFSSGTAF